MRQNSKVALVSANAVVCVSMNVKVTNIYIKAALCKKKCLIMKYQLQKNKRKLVLMIGLK